MNVPLWLCIVIALLLAVICGVIAFLAGVSHRKKIAEATIGSAEQEAKRIVSDAIKSAEAKKKEAILEGKDEIHRLRNESEREINDRRKEVQRQERRIQQKEETLDKKWRALRLRKRLLATKTSRPTKGLRRRNR